MNLRATLDWSARIQHLATAIVFFLALPACRHEVAKARDGAGLSHLNSESIKQIKVANPDDFSFVFLGDNKGSGAPFEKMLQEVSREKAAAFVFDDGDLVPSGRASEFAYFLDQLRRNLTLPLLAATGNHEVKNHGATLYCQIFGPTHYAFRIGRTALIVADDASEKLTDAEAQWLDGELQSARDCANRLVILHVPPFDPRGGGNHHCLDAGSARRLMEILKRGKATRILTGHIHGYYTGDWEGIPFVISGGGGAKLADTDPRHGFFHYLMVRVRGEKVEAEVRRMPPS
jgi:hypothetical protein